MTESRFPPVQLPDSELARQLQRYCLSFDGAWEDYPWGDIVYKVGTKIFCFLGGDGPSLGMTVKATRDDAAVLTQLPNITRAPYIGQHGWVSVEFGGPDDLPFARDLIATSYDLIAPKKLRRGPGPEAVA